MAFEFSVKIGSKTNKANTPTILNPSNNNTLSTFEANRILAGLTSYGSAYKIDCKTSTGQQKAYDECSAVQSVIDKRSQFCSNGKLIVDGKPITEQKLTDPTIKLLTAPNPMQTIGEFINEVNVYRDAFGYCPIFKVIPAGSKTPVLLYAINPVNFKYTTTRKLFFQTTLQGIIDSIDFTNQQGESIHLQGEQVNQVYILKGRNPSKLYSFTGQSGLYSLSDAVSNFNAGLNVYGQLVRQSIAGIIANRSNNQDGITNAISSGDEIEKVQTHMANHYGLIEGRNQFIVTNANLLFQSMLTNVGNLNIPAQITLSVNAICDKLGFSPELMAEKQGTYENKKAAEVGHYQNETIPTMNEMGRMFSEITGRIITFDFSHIAVLQEAEFKSVESYGKSVDIYGKLYKDNTITLNQYLAEIGQPPKTDGDKYYNEIESIPLAVRFGVGGTQAMQGILIDATLTPEQKVGILQVLFSISEIDANRMLNI